MVTESDATFEILNACGLRLVVPDGKDGHHQPYLSLIVDPEVFQQSLYESLHSRFANGDSSPLSLSPLTFVKAFIREWLDTDREVVISSPGVYALSLALQSTHLSKEPCARSTSESSTKCTWRLLSLGPLITATMGKDRDLLEIKGSRANCRDAMWGFSASLFDDLLPQTLCRLLLSMHCLQKPMADHLCALLPELAIEESRDLHGSSLFDVDLLDTYMQLHNTGDGWRFFDRGPLTHFRALIVRQFRFHESLDTRIGFERHVLDKMLLSFSFVTPLVQMEMFQLFPELVDSNAAVEEVLKVMGDWLLHLEASRRDIQSVEVSASPMSLTVTVVLMAMLDCMNSLQFAPSCNFVQLRNKLYDQSIQNLRFVDAPHFPIFLGFLLRHAFSEKYEALYLALKQDCLQWPLALEDCSSVSMESESDGQTMSTAQWDGVISSLLLETLRDNLRVSDNLCQFFLLKLSQLAESPTRTAQWTPFDVSIFFILLDLHFSGGFYRTSVMEKTTTHRMRPLNALFESLTALSLFHIPPKDSLLCKCTQFLYCIRSCAFRAIANGCIGYITYLFELFSRDDLHRRYSIPFDAKASTLPISASCLKIRYLTNFYMAAVALSKDLTHTRKLLMICLDKLKVCSYASSGTLVSFRTFGLSYSLLETALLVLSSVCVRHPLVFRPFGQSLSLVLEKCMPQLPLSLLQPVFLSLRSISYPSFQSLVVRYSKWLSVGSTRPLGLLLGISLLRELGDYEDVPVSSCNVHLDIYRPLWEACKDSAMLQAYLFDSLGEAMTHQFFSKDFRSVIYEDAVCLFDKEFIQQNKGDSKVLYASASTPLECRPRFELKATSKVLNFLDFLSASYFPIHLCSLLRLIVICESMEAPNSNGAPETHSYLEEYFCMPILLPLRVYSQVSSAPIHLVSPPPPSLHPFAVFTQLMDETKEAPASSTTSHPVEAEGVTVFETLEQTQQHFVIHSLYFAICWFRELTSAYARRHVDCLPYAALQRLEEAFALEVELSDCLQRTDNYSPPVPPLTPQDAQSLIGLGSESALGYREEGVKRFESSHDWAGVNRALTEAKASVVAATKASEQKITRRKQRLLQKAQTALVEEVLSALPSWSLHVAAYLMGVSLFNTGAADASFCLRPHEHQSLSLISFTRIATFMHHCIRHCGSLTDATKIHSSTAYKIQPADPTAKRGGVPYLLLLRVHYGFRRLSLANTSIPFLLPQALAAKGLCALALSVLYVPLAYPIVGWVAPHGVSLLQAVQEGLPRYIASLRFILDDSVSVLIPLKSSTSLSTQPSHKQQQEEEAVTRIRLALLCIEAYLKMLTEAICQPFPTLLLYPCLYLILLAFRFNESALTHTSLAIYKSWKLGQPCVFPKLPELSSLSLDKANYLRPLVFPNLSRIQSFYWQSYSTLPYYTQALPSLDTNKFTPNHRSLHTDKKLFDEVWELQGVDQSIVSSVQYIKPLLFYLYPPVMQYFTNLAKLPIFKIEVAHKLLEILTLLQTCLEWSAIGKEDVSKQIFCGKQVVSQAANRFLNIKWGEVDAAFKPRDTLFLVKVAIASTAEEPLDYLMTLGSSVYPLLLQRMGDVDVVIEDYKLLDFETLPYFLRCSFEALNAHFLKFVDTLQKSKQIYPSAAYLDNCIPITTKCVSILGCFIALSRHLQHSSILLLCLQKGRQFIDLFSKAFSYFSPLLKTHFEGLVCMLKALQTSTRQLHAIGNAVKNHKDRRLSNEIPMLKQVLESLVCTINEAFSRNQCMHAIKIGKLKHKGVGGKDYLPSQLIDEEEEEEEEESPQEDNATVSVLREKNGVTEN